MEKKDLWMIGGASVAVVTTIVTGTLYLVKTKNKRKNEGRLKESVAILEASLENKSWWLTNECQTRSREIILWAKEKTKETNELEAEFKVIKEKHWMTKDYQNAFRAIYDWVKTQI